MKSEEKKVRAVIIARGDVQRVGYRDAVERAARKLKITGYVENLKPYDVKIVCEGDKESVELFREKIKIREFPIDVEDIEVGFEEITGEFEYFEIRRGEWKEELGERIDAARAELKQNTFILKEFRNESNENFKLLHSDNLTLQEIMAKHDTETKELFGVVNREISGIKERLAKLEAEA